MNGGGQVEGKGMFLVVGKIVLAVPRPVAFSS